MRLDKINNVFRPGDYSLDLKWFKSKDALDTLIIIGSLVRSANTNLVINRYQREKLEFFNWNKDNIQNAILECVTRFLQLRGDENRLDTPMMIFRTDVEGIDISIVLQIVDQEQPLVKIFSLDFETEHLGQSDGILSNELLRNLFIDLALISVPDYAVLRRVAPVTADWYWEAQAEVDTQKVPITFEWLKFLFLGMGQKNRRCQI